MEPPLQLSLPREEFELLRRHTRVTDKFAFKFQEDEAAASSSCSASGAVRVSVSEVPYLVKFHSERYLEYNLPSPLPEYVGSALMVRTEASCQSLEAPILMQDLEVSPKEENLNAKKICMGDGSFLAMQ